MMFTTTFWSWSARIRYRNFCPSLAQNQSSCVVFMVDTALGPEQWIAALGGDRVMLGFAFAGGRREGSLDQAMSRSSSMDTMHLRSHRRSD